METGQNHMGQTTTSNKVIKKIKKLSVLVKQDGLCFYCENDDIKEKIAEKKFPYSRNPIELLREIELCYENTPELNEKFSGVDVIYDHNIYSLVPTEFFDESIVSDYLKYNIRILKTDFAAYDNVPELGLIVVYIPYANINNYFFERYGSFDFFHVVSRRLIEMRLTEETSAIAFINGNLLQLSIASQKKLCLFNTYEIENAEDTAYYILFSLIQNRFDLNKDKLSILEPKSHDDTLWDMLFPYIRNMEYGEHFFLNTTCV